MLLARTHDINQFLQRRQPQWDRLEALLARVEASGLESLSPPEVREFGALYRRASSDLVTARARTANAELLQYLNDLVARAYARVYRSRRFHPKDIVTFLWVDFPRLFRYAWKYIALAFAVMLLSGVGGWEMSRRDPAGAYYMLPAEMIKNIPITRQIWSRRTGHSMAELPPTFYPTMSSFIMTHNIAIGVASFAGGIAFGLPSLYVLIQTGMMVGILGEGMTRPKTALVFWSLILPHGFIELAAICVMCGAGFLLASSLLAPGNRSRRDALIERGRLAVLVALGGGAMLVVAGLIEGFITPPDFIPPVAKLGFAGLTVVAMVLYFSRCGRGPEPGLLRDLIAYEETPKALPRL